MATTGASGKIITFYSFKGGTGRSMSMANVAWVLASNGLRVLTVDWDLEAPGLHRYFSPFLLDKDLTSSEGVIDFIIDYASAAMTPAEGNKPLPNNWYVPYANILRYATSLNWRFPGKGRLDFIPAGRQGPSYSTRVNSFNWQDFYDRLGGWSFLEVVKEKMRAEYDYILIDSRTGVSDTSGICTVQMPDTLVICFLLNNQSIEGSASVASSVQVQRKDPALRILPVSMRVENAEKDKRDRRKDYAKRKFAEFPAQFTEEVREQYRGKVQFPYIPYYAYEEILATFGDEKFESNTVLESAERLTSYITDGKVSELKISGERARRREILNAYARPTSQVEDAVKQSRTREMLALLPGILRKGFRQLQSVSLVILLIAVLLLFILLLLQRSSSLAASQQLAQAEAQRNSAQQSLSETKAQLQVAQEALKVANNNQLQLQLLEEKTKEAQLLNEQLTQQNSIVQTLKRQSQQSDQQRAICTREAALLADQYHQCSAKANELQVKIEDLQRRLKGQ